MLRLAKITDVEAIFSLAETFYQSIPHKDFAQFSPEKVRAEIRGYITGDKTSRVMIVAEDRNTIFGLLSAIVVPVFFSTEKRAYESVWYVDPQYHYHPDAVRLFLAYEVWAKKIGCTSIGTSTMVNERLERFFEKRGYTKLETSFVKRIKWD